MTTLEYRGYIGSVSFDAEAEILHGTVVNTRDVITFQGESVSEIKQAFKESVEDYLAFCAELGEEPEKPMSGRFNVRISPLLHAQAVAMARSQEISLNTLVERAINDVVNRSASVDAQSAQDHQPNTDEECDSDREIYDVAIHWSGTRLAKASSVMTSMQQSLEVRVTN